MTKDRLFNSTPFDLVSRIERNKSCIFQNIRGFTLLPKCYARIFKVYLMAEILLAKTINSMLLSMK